MSYGIENGFHEGLAKDLGFICRDTGRRDSGLPEVCDLMQSLI
jgi:hypothetical protein